MISANSKQNMSFLPETFPPQTCICNIQQSTSSCQAGPYSLSFSALQLARIFLYVFFEPQPLHICVGKAWGLKNNPSPDPAQCGKPTALGTPFLCNWFLPGSSPTSTNSNTHNRLLSWSSWDHLRSTRWQPGPPNAGASCTFDFCLPFTIFSSIDQNPLTTCKRGFMFSKIIFLHWVHFYNL